MKRRTDGVCSKGYAHKLAQICPILSAVRFFVLNRISFSGTVDSGGYSEGAYHGRFTDSSIRRVAELGKLLNDVKITNTDYKKVIRTPGQEVFIFLDPPYLVATKSRIYGVNGALHTGFDHDAFAAEMRASKHYWLISIMILPKFARILPLRFRTAGNCSME